MTTTTEMSVDQCAKLAAKDPLPTWRDEEDERATREWFAKEQHRQFALVLTGERTVASMRRFWKIRQREILDSRRWDAWLERNNAKFDTHRGCYLVTIATPDAA